MTTAEAVGEAERLYAQGAFAEAAAVLAPHATADQTDPTPFRLRGLALLRQGALTDALASLEDARRRAPDDPWVNLHYGMGLQASGRVAEAIPHYRHAAGLLPEEVAPLLNWAAAMLAVGAPDDAVRLAKRAKRRAPAMPEAHFILGQALLAAGRWADAADACDTAARLAPGNAEAWVNLGFAEYRRGRIEAATAAMRAALSVDPRNVAAAAALGVFLRLTGAAEEAEQIFRAVGRAPHAAEARLALAAGLARDGRTREALAILQAEQPAAPALRQVWALRLALTLLDAGGRERAREILAGLGPVPPGFVPLRLWAAVRLAQEDGAADEAQARAEDLADVLARAGDSVAPELRIEAWGDLARYHDSLGDADRAFRCWQAVRAALRTMQPWSAAGEDAFVDASIAAFPAQRFGRRPPAPGCDTSPVFIVGLPHSGIALAAAVIGAHPHVHHAGARAALAEAFGALAGGFGTGAAKQVAALEESALDAAAAGYLAALRAAAPDAARIVDSAAGNFRFLGLAALLLPGARVIHCVRDEQDAALAILAAPRPGAHPYAHDLGDLARFMAAHERMMAHWHAVLPIAVLRLRLEDWATDFSGTLARVLEFLGLPPADPCAAVDIAQAPEIRGIGAARPYARHLTAIAGAAPPRAAAGGDPG